MHFKSQALQILRTILKAGDGGTITLKVPAKTNPLSGIPSGQPTYHEVPFAVVNYTREDISDPSLANGLMKILLSPLDKEEQPIPDFLSIVENKNTVAILTNGDVFKMLHTKTTKPDGKTALVTRSFLGG